MKICADANSLPDQLWMDELCPLLLHVLAASLTHCLGTLHFLQEYHFRVIIFPQWVLAWYPKAISN